MMRTTMGKIDRQVAKTAQNQNTTVDSATTLTIDECNKTMQKGIIAFKSQSFGDAVVHFENAIRKYKQLLSDRPHDKHAREGLISAWTAISNVYPSSNLIEASPSIQSAISETAQSRFGIQNFKTILLDGLVENSWRKQCEGKYGGPKPQALSWKRFYESNEKQLATLEAQAAFFWAVKNGHTQLVKQSLKNKVDINAHCEAGDTPLILAVSGEHTDLVKLLLKNGAKSNCKGLGKWTPLHWAVYIMNLELVEIFIKQKISVNAKDVKGFSPLHLAAFRGDALIVSYLLNNKAKVNVSAEDKSTPLHWAVFAGYADIVELLVKAGAKLDVQDEFGRTLLHWTASKGRSDMMDMLLSGGAKPDIKDQFGRMPLHWACEQGGFDCVIALIESSPQLTIQDKYGDTPLMLAARKQDNKVVSLLFEKGAR